MDTQKQESAASPEFHFLAEKALQLGAKEVRVIPASLIVIENRVTLKCRSGCVTYGKNSSALPMFQPLISSGKSYANTVPHFW